MECFSYDQTLDRCSYCLSSGLCLKGNPNQSNEFLCLCPSCYSGRYCQFSSKSFTFILDQLFYTDLASCGRETISRSIIIGALLSFFLAIPNNLFTIVTLQRRSCRQTGIGYYLLYISFIHQINLGLVSARLIHLSLIITHPRFQSTIDNVLCKLLNYFLICFTRTSYWFASFVALERVYTTIFLNGHRFKKPNIARRLMAGMFSIILLSTAYELVFVRLFISAESDDRSAMCVMDFSMSHGMDWIVIHQTISLLHFIIPLLINIFATITITCIVIKKKMKINMANRCK